MLISLKKIAPPVININYKENFDKKRTPSIQTRDRRLSLLPSFEKNRDAEGLLNMGPITGRFLIDAAAMGMN